MCSGAHPQGDDDFDGDQEVGGRGVGGPEPRLQRPQQPCAGPLLQGRSQCPVHLQGKGGSGRVDAGSRWRHSCWMPSYRHGHNAACNLTLAHSPAMPPDQQGCSVRSAWACSDCRRKR